MIRLSTPLSSARLADMLLSLRERLTQRSDSEHIAVLYRYGVCLFVYGSLMIGMKLEDSAAHHFYNEVKFATIVFLCITTAQFLHLLIKPEPSPGRRLLSIVNDQWMLTYAAFALGTEGTNLYPFYFWTILAAGFRYGRPYLLTSAGLSALSLLCLYQAYDLWYSNTIVCLIQLLGIAVLTFAISSFLSTIREAIEAAHEATRAKSTFLATISHEVRTPLTAIKGLSELLRDTRLDNEQRHMVSVISESGNSLLTLINHVLDYSRAESGKMPERHEDYDLFAMLGRIYRLFLVQARSKGLELSIHIDPEIPALHSGNRQFLEDTLVNLLSNAIKFTSTGHVTLRVSQFQPPRSAPFIRFDVIDTGLGIADDVRDKIFESFTQSDDTILSNFGGSGLGLALCRQYARSMGGQIAVVSELGKGSCFSVTIPSGSSGEARFIPQKGLDPTKRVMVGFVSQDPALIDKVQSVHADCRIFMSLDQAFESLSRRAKRDGASLLLVDQSVTIADMTHSRNQIAKLPDIASIHVAWLCDCKNCQSTLLSNRPHHSLAVVDEAQLGTQLPNLCELVVNLNDTSGKEGALDPVADDERLHILVADDNRTNQMVIEKTLQHLGHTVELVANGKEAVDRLRHDHFDLVFLDINMPVMNGLEAAKACGRKVKAGMWPSCPPLVALTADASPEMEARCKDAGMEACLLKPIDRSQLNALLAPYMRDMKHKSAEKSQNAEDAALKDDLFLTMETLNNLQDLGGETFVADLARQFSEDGIEALKRLSVAVGQCDDDGFRDEAHALRSAAANIGAKAVFDLCLSWREVSAAELHIEGVHHLVELANNMNESIAALEHHLSIALPKADVDADLKVAEDQRAKAG